jgi:hypothetical protein
LAKYNAEALDQCRTTASDRAGKFGAIGDSFSDAPSSADVFGGLASSGALASAVSALDQLVGAEFAAAESLLHEVERSLDSVQTDVTERDAAGGDQIRRKGEL